MIIVKNQNIEISLLLKKMSDSKLNNLIHWIYQELSSIDNELKKSGNDFANSAHSVARSLLMQRYQTLLDVLSVLRNEDKNNNLN